MPVVKIVPMPGPEGPQGPAGTGDGGSADIADFTFTNNSPYDPETFNGGDSEISLHNKDFSIITTRDQLTEEQINEFGNIDADINLRAADDIFITAQGDEATIEANNNVTIVSDYQEIGNVWEFNKDGRLYLPNSTEFYDERETVVTQESRSISTPIDYLGNSPTNNTTAVYLEVTETSSWMADNFNNRLSSTITFGDSEVLPLIAIYQANVGETQVMIFQWDGSRDVAWPVQIDQESNVYEDVASASIRVPIINSESEFSRWIFSSSGSLTLPASGEVINESDSSGDGNGYSTIKIVPDSSLETDQYLIFDPTQPNHIHIRAGGAIDESTADLIIGGENTNIKISDQIGSVDILAADININSNLVPASLNINTYSGATINSARTSSYDPEDKVVATLGDIELSIANAASAETSFTVNGGTTATQPTFNGAPLFSGTYVKVGPQVHFQIQVDMDNITSFGTGQYYVDLPFDAKYGYQFKEGCLHHISTSNQYAIGGHVAAGTNRLFLTYTGSNGQDEMFDYNSPVTLNTADNFHIAGTYITA